MVARALLLLALAGCQGGAEYCPDGPMSEGDAGLIVTQDEHPTGWGAPHCLGCHSLAVLHDEDCTPWVDPELLRETVFEEVELEGSEACTRCHGANGTEP